MDNKPQPTDNTLHYKKLRALAYFYASMQEHSANDLVDCIIPLIKYAIIPIYGEQFDAQKASKLVKETFPFLDLPIYMISQLMPRLIKDRFIEENWSGIYLIKDVSRVDTQFELSLNSNNEEIEALITDLSMYAASKNFLIPPSFENWESALIDFFNNANISDMLNEDKNNSNSTVYFLIASYISNQAQLKKEQIGICAKLYYAISVIDLIVNMSYNFSDNDKHLNNLIVFYDTTVIMRLLGTSGKYLQEATMQMHKALLKLKCSISYFKHVYDEVDSSLDYIAHSRYNKERRLHPETQEAIIYNEFHPEKAHFIRTSLEAELKNLDILDMDINYKDFYTQDQIDENAFTYLLGEGALRYNLEARKNDARSLAYIVSLRAGQTSRNLSMCKCIIVTDNNRFFNKSKDFCIDNSIMARNDIPPVSTLGNMTTLTWLLTAKDFPEELVTTKLLSDCYSARIPSAGWENAFWEKHKSENMDPTEQMNAITNYTARMIALEESFGDSNIIPHISTTEILARAKKEITQQKKESLAKGHEEGKKELYDEIQKNFQQKSIQHARAVVKFIRTIILLICIVAFFKQQTLTGRGIISSVTCASFADLVGLKIVAKFFLGLENKIQRLINSIYECILPK